MAKSKNKNPFQEYLDKLPAPLKNKYFVGLVIFFAWMVFIDKHNILVQWQLQRTLKKLEQDKVYYDEKIQEAIRMRNDLQVNQEKFAREQYFMKRSNEDVFIIDKE